MKRIAICALIGLVVAGCVVPSVYPYYHEKDVVFEQSLVGSWRPVSANGDSKETWTFAKEGDNAYEFTDISEGATNVMIAHLFKMKGRLFMDCLLVPPDNSMSIPGHYLAQVNQIRPTFKPSWFAAEWMKDFIDKNPKAIRHVMAPDKQGSSDEHVVLTADTKELQEFVLKHIDEPKCFLDGDEMKPVDTK